MGDFDGNGVTGDFNGDGADDIVVAAPTEANASNVTSGSISIRFGISSANCGDGFVGGSEECDDNDMMTTM